MQIVLACTALAAGIFIIDVASLPLGVAAGVAYVAVVLISLLLPRRQYSFIVAGGVSILTILGFLLSEPAGIPWMVVAKQKFTGAGSRQLKSFSISKVSEPAPVNFCSADNDTSSESAQSDTFDFGKLITRRPRSKLAEISWSSDTSRR